jgi:hypothetical protein
MSECWASDLGNCGGGNSREHLVSASAFTGEAIELYGLEWCRDQPKVIGLASFVSRILCRKHNSQLSELDEAAGDFLEALRELEELARISKSGIIVQPNTTRRIDGSKFERWLLKTTVNLCYGATWHTQQQPTSKPPGSLVEVVFGLRPFPPGTGLHRVTGPAHQFASSNRIGFAPLICIDNEIIGSLWSLYGFKFALFLVPPESIANTHFAFEVPWLIEWPKQLRFERRPAGLKAHLADGSVRTVDFAWRSLQ